ncbi:MAG TPA: Fur family transcriptional regulator [Acidimicrobiales bacterium]|jgi:Fe2+ or Zn2+ uptake regulation protein|nr:Fur family transcriptional regulator [Acidimicrobiales bacterium]|tara:strand:- start:2064 stop:2519 length:456 start_codon:yes stop_codon:yes gene_type:complete
MDHFASEANELHVIVGRRLHAAKMRYSKSRYEIVKILMEGGRPMTLPEILEVGKLQGLAQSSAYRNLSEMAEIGIVRHIYSGDDHSRFELDESLTGHHHHLECTQCGRLEDFVVPEKFEQIIKDLVTTAEQQGFKAASHRFDILGRCGECA